MNKFASRQCAAGTLAVPLFLIISGAILLLNDFGIVSVNRMWDLWPLLLISIGIEQMVPYRRNRG